MKRKCLTVRILTGWFALVAVIGLLSGCATHSTDWPVRVGNYTYDQAVTEMGPPEKSARLSDGTLVADWLTRRGQTQFITSPGSFYPYGLGRAGNVSTFNTPDHFLRLTFDPAGKLKTWKQFMR